MKGRRATNAPIPSAFVHWEKDLLPLKKGQPGKPTINVERCCVPHYKTV